MPKPRFFVAGFLTLSLAAGAALAAGHEKSAVDARQGQMRVMAFNLGILGSMAKGALDYDAERAKIAAGNLAAVAKLDQTGYYPEDTDAGFYDGSAALPALFENPEDYDKKLQDLVAATDQMQAAAGEGLDALRAQMAAVGGACTACHKAYRKPSQ